MKNANRIKTLEQSLHDTEEQAIEASRRVRDFFASRVRHIHVKNMLYYSLLHRTDS